MKRKLSMLLVLCFTFGIASVFGSSNKETLAEDKTITVFNAASTTDLMNEIGELFYNETGVKVNFNPAASGTLARQLEQGAEADLFISASKKWMTYVNDLGLSKESVPFVRNNLVLIAPLNSKLEQFAVTAESDLPTIFKGRISIGDPEFVPAGNYAKEALTYYGWYEKLTERIQPGADVRAALAVVELEEADLGIVYSSDAQKSDKVKVVGSFPIESHTPVEYYCGSLKDSSSQGDLFYNYLISNEEVFKLYAKYGFEPAK